MVTVGVVEGCDVMKIAVVVVLVVMVTMPLLSKVNVGVGTTVCMYVVLKCVVNVATCKYNDIDK